MSSVGGSKEFRRPPLVKYDELCALMSHMPANLRFPEASEAKQLWNKARAVRPTNTMQAQWTDLKRSGGQDKKRACPCHPLPLLMPLPAPVSLSECRPSWR